ncbi:MAG: hypothetical protein BWY02_02063 [bacterium ADurb.Bin157]|nr:MAG: hypothetical protein BWY02_02063 [bacterium ADurb.Bin157]
MDKKNWTFKKYFRREAYGWKGTAKASKRMAEAVSEMKKAAKKDSALAGEGAIELFGRLYPALMQIDSSSGVLGTAMNKTIDSLIPFIIQADWDINTRGKQLDKLYEAIIEDGWGTFDGLRDCWGEICVYPELANIWADRLIDDVKEVFSKQGASFFRGSDMCLSCLLYTKRYEELQALLETISSPWWTYNKFGAMALLNQGKYDEALDYAADVSSASRTNNDQHEIDDFCESVLIKKGRIDDAYEKYGLKIPDYGTNLNIYRNICKKYPTIDKRKILIDCISKKGSKGKWFASARHSGFLDLALECAKAYDADPKPLLNAADDLCDSNPEYAVEFVVEAIRAMLTGSFYEPIEQFEVRVAFRKLTEIAKKNNLHGLAGKLFDKMLKENWHRSDKRLITVFEKAANV